MNNLFVPQEQAFELKTLGFDEECFCFYAKDNTIVTIVNKPVSYTTALNYIFFKDKLLAPLYQQALDWFRNKHNLHPHIYYLEETSKWYGDVRKLPTNGLVNLPLAIKGDTYPDVRLLILKECINYLLRKQANNKIKNAIKNT